MTQSQHTSRSDDAKAFRVSGLKKTYRLDRQHSVHVLNGLDFSVARGEWLALTGASGSGKTTLLHLLAGLDRPDSGAITCLGEELHRLGARRRCAFRRLNIGLVFQQYHLLPELSALENVILPNRLESTAAKAAERSETLLGQLGLAERLHHRPQELSGGEQQRVALARALVNDPEIILADEPTGNLDETAAQHILDTLEKLCVEHGKTLIMVTHDTGLAHRAQRIRHLNNGRIEPHHSG